MIDRRALLASTLALASCGAGEAPVRRRPALSAR